MISIDTVITRLLESVIMEEWLDGVFSNRFGGGPLYILYLDIIEKPFLKITLRIEKVGFEKEEDKKDCVSYQVSKYFHETYGIVPIDTRWKEHERLRLEGVLMRILNQVLLFKTY